MCNLLYLILLCLFLSSDLSCNDKKKVDPDKIQTKNKLIKSFDEIYVYKENNNLKNINVLNILQKVSNKEKVIERKSRKESDDIPDTFVIVHVNNDVITNIDIVNAIRFIFFLSGKEYNKKLAKLLVPAVTNCLIDRKLLQQYADTCKMKIDNNDIDRNIRTIARNNGITPDKLIENLGKAGINIRTFKENIKCEMLRQFIRQSLSEEYKVTKQELNKEKIRLNNKLSQKRFNIIEIFLPVNDKDKAISRSQIKKNAELILCLVKNGFNFSILASALSNNGYNCTKDETEKTLEKQVFDVIRRMKPGECSDVIETKLGFKIIYLVDTADAWKAGTMRSNYKVLICKAFKIQDPLYTAKDVEKIKEQIDHIMKTSTSKQFREVCKKQGVEFDEMKILNSDESITSMSIKKLAMKSKIDLKPIISQDPNNKSYINILMFESEESPNVTIPSDKELLNTIQNNKVECEINRNFNSRRNTAVIKYEIDNLEGIIK